MLVPGPGEGAARCQPQLLGTGRACRVLTVAVGCQSRLGARSCISQSTHSQRAGVGMGSVCAQDEHRDMPPSCSPAGMCFVCDDEEGRAMVFSVTCPRSLCPAWLHRTHELNIPLSPPAKTLCPCAPFHKHM